ncbi:MAG: VWA domain-containing protein, partial [Planctomycetes bacterium]|nr:VWA domain-containing protein [Planctomycetota bacterium]
NITPTHGCADLPGTLALVDAILQRSPARFKERKILFVSDLQKGSWLGNGAGPANALFSKIRTKAVLGVVDVGVEIPSNLAITNLEIDGQIAGVSAETRFIAKLQAYGDKPQSRVKVRLLAGKIMQGADSVSLAQVIEESVDMQASSQATVLLKYQFKEPGDYAVQMQLDQDNLAVDDSCRVIVRVSKELNILLVNGRYSARDLERSTGFLQIALDNEGVDSIPLKFKARSIDEPRLVDELNKGLVNYDSVFFCDVARWRASEARMVAEFVRKGGGAVFWLGEQAEPASYNDNLFQEGKGLLPAKLIKPLSALKGSLFQFQSEPSAFQYPPLSAFRTAEDKQSLLVPRFTTAFQTEPLPKSLVRNLANFKSVNLGGAVDENKNGSLTLPALLGWQPSNYSLQKNSKTTDSRSKGWVYLACSSANTEWNNWPAYPSYLPFVQELMLASCAGKLKEQSQFCTTTIEDYPTQQSGEVKISLPDGTSETLPLIQDQEVSRMAFNNTTKSGFYFAKYLAAQSSICFALNPMLSPMGEAGSESDLSRTSLEEINQFYPEANFSLVKDAAVFMGENNSGVAPDNEDKGMLREKIAGVFLLLFLLFSIGEFLFSWLMGIGRSLTPSPKKPLLIMGLSWFVLIPMGFCLVGMLGNSSGTNALSFLPAIVVESFESARGRIEVEEGETLQTRLITQNEFTPVINSKMVRFSILGVLVFCTGMAFVRLIFNRSALGAITLAGLRLGFWWVLLWVLMPQIGLGFERFTWPDVAILIDDSQSMSVSDKYQDEARDIFSRKIADASSQQVNRIGIARSILSENQGKFLANILDRKFRIHLYHLSARAEKIALISNLAEIPEALNLIRALKPDPSHDSSKIGNACRQVLNDFRGTPLGGVVLFSDGVVTDGEELSKVTKFAVQSAVPFFAIGLGEEMEPKDLAVLDVQGPDEIAFGDRVVLDVKVSSAGYKNFRTSVFLKEKGKPDIIDRQEVTLDETGIPSVIRLVDKPKTEGLKLYEIEIPAQNEESQKTNNKIEKNVLVQQASTVRILFVEGCRRYEYHYLKTLLERQSEVPGGRKLFSLNVLLLEADPDFSAQDRTAIADLPTRSELFLYDVVIFGDVDPKSREAEKFKRFLSDLNEFAREKGGGILFLAGQRFFPSEYAASLRDLLPVEINANTLIESPEGINQGYRMIPAASASTNPIFRFHSEEKENASLWSRLKEMYWCFAGIVPKKGAEVLASAEGGNLGFAGKNVPLMVLQYYGAGRVLFFAFDESWRWAYREDQVYYNYFWLQTLRFLSRNSVSKISLKLDKAGNYRRGDSIRILLRLPLEASGAEANSTVRVSMERKNIQDGKGKEIVTVELAKVAGSRGAFEAIIDNAREGKYLFQVLQPLKQDPPPIAECIVLPPPGEMEKLTMAQHDLTKMALTTRGKFYFPDQAASLPSDLPRGFQISSGSPSPPWDLWNHPLVFILVLLLLTLNWFLGRRLQLL